MKVTNETRREVMKTAWNAFRLRNLPGSNVRTFADAMRNAWAWVKSKAAPVVKTTKVLVLNTMLQSPIRRSLGDQAYAYTRAREAGRLTTALGF